MPNEKFSYRHEKFTKDIGNTFSTDRDTGFASRVDGSYITLTIWSPRVYPPAEHPNMGKNFGWKFHVSIDDTDEDNLTAGWDLVKDILIEHKIFSAKVVHPKFIPMHERMPMGGITGAQRGKQITIYAFCENDGYDWLPVLEEITRALAAANVRPSFTPQGCQPIAGSHYISYRNDGNQNDTGPGPRDHRFNPFGKPDPFAALTLNLDNIQQPPIPAWVPPNNNNNNNNVNIPQMP